MTEARPYQVHLYCGDNPPIAEGVKVTDVTPTSAEPDAVFFALSAAGLSPADLRARVLFVVDDTDDPAAVRRDVATYAAWVGFAGRRIDVGCGERVVAADDLVAHVARLGDRVRPDSAPEVVQIGAPRTDDLPVVAAAGLDEASVTALRHARRVRFAPTGTSMDAISRFLVISGIRSRGDLDRFPYVVEGSEPADVEGVVGTCADELRRRAQELRRSLRMDNRDALAPVAELGERRRRLLAASAVDIADAMSRLGATQDAETELWHCPRPSRHTNGDANASMRIQKGRVKCFRCDAERIDSLRLVADTLGLTVDDAADWLLSDRRLDERAG